jgi:hypothetical protein
MPLPGATGHPETNKFRTGGYFDGFVVPVKIIPARSHGLDESSCAPRGLDGAAAMLYFVEPTSE